MRLFEDGWKFGEVTVHDRLVLFDEGIEEGLIVEPHGERL